jgi:hypothetical protein
MLTLEKETVAFLKDGIKVVAHQDQKFFMTTSKECEKGLRDMINGLESYCLGLDKEYGTKVGNDYYLAPNVKDIAHALINMLSGPGKFDGGTVDKVIRKICNQAEIELE